MYAQWCCEIKRQQPQHISHHLSICTITTYAFTSGLSNSNESCASTRESLKGKDVGQHIGKNMSANMCWQHIQRWSFWSKRVIMQIASSSSMARFHYIFQRSQDTSQQLKHFCITKTQSSEDLPAGFAIAIKDWSSKMICHGNSKGFRGETIRSYPLQCKQLTSGHIDALGSPATL